MAAEADKLHGAVRLSEFGYLAARIRFGESVQNFEFFAVLHQSNFKVVIVGAHGRVIDQQLQVPVGDRVGMLNVVEIRFDLLDVLLKLAIVGDVRVRFKSFAGFESFAAHQLIGNGGDS